MAACAAALANSPATFGQRKRVCGWQRAPTTPAHVTRRTGTVDQPAPSPARGLTVRTQAAHTAAADLAVYKFAARRGGTAAEWFQQAVRRIVKEVDQAPFLQTVQLSSCGPDGSGSPRICTFGVHDSVVAVPELWQGVAEHVSSHSPDVVILVQRVSPNAAAGSPQSAMDAAEAAQTHAAAPGTAQQQGSPRAVVTVTPAGGGHSAHSSGSLPGSPRSPRSAEARLQAEEACRRLVCSGLADSVLQGQVGDCCDGSSHGHPETPPQLEQQQGGVAAAAASASAAGDARQPAPRPLPLPAIVPFSPASVSLSRRKALRAAALGASPSSGGGSAAAAAAGCQQSACYWGVVVQSRGRRTGAEGCYLLKTVRNVSPSTGCTCTHYSLTRISQGEHLEQQFVQSWLV